jgi:hypothetical protein
VHSSLAASLPHPLYTQHIAGIDQATAQNHTMKRHKVLNMSSNIPTDTTTATETALKTTELLEQILSCLPLPQILGKARVCRKWKSVVDGSSSLRDILFLPRHGGQTEIVSPERSYFSTSNYFSGVPIMHSISIL